MSRKESFSTRLSQDLLIVTSIVLLTTLGIAAYSSHKLLAEEAQKSTERLRDGIISKIELVMGSIENTVNTAAWLVAERRQDTSYLYHITRELIESNPNIVGCAIAFVPGYFKSQYYYSPYSYRDLESGEIFSKQLGEAGESNFGREWFEYPYRTKKAHWCEPYFDEDGAGFMMSTYSVPIKDEKGQVVAILTADLALDWISTLLDKVKPYDNSVVIMMTPKGTLINARVDTLRSGVNIFSQNLFQDMDTEGLEAIAEAMMNGEKATMQYRMGKEIAFAAFAPLANNWILLITCQYKEVLKRSTEMQIILLLIGFAGLTVLFLLCYFTIKRLTRPLTDITESAKKIAEGNFNVPLPDIKSKDEIFRLKEAFDVMQKDLHKYMEATKADERIQNELRIASNIQQAMLPKDFPETDQIDLMAKLIPAKEVGGDLYDFFFKDDYLYFTVGDVSGKGVPASLIMAITRFSFRFIANLGVPVDEVVSKINNAISYNNETNMFVTLFVGRLNLKSGIMEYCNAGHNPIVINGKFLEQKPNLAVGLISDFPYEQQSIHLDNGSTILLYTDGITEAERADKVQFGEDRLIEWANGPIRNASAKDACNDLLRATGEFTEGNEQNDDITVMTINYK